MGALQVEKRLAFSLDAIVELLAAGVPEVADGRQANSPLPPQVQDDVVQHLVPRGVRAKAAGDLLPHLVDWHQAGAAVLSPAQLLELSQDGLGEILRVGRQ